MTPVVLLTGFLGSGKTTLLNALLRARRDDSRRFAVIVNEFGDVGIDGDLLPDAQARQVELPGGCICCLLDEDLEKTLLELTATTPDLELILIETTGIAEPLSISWSLGREPLSQYVRLAAVLTVVDTCHHLEHRSLAPAVDNQVEYADVLVPTKLDLATAEQRAALLGHLRDKNPRAALILEQGPALVERIWLTLADPAVEETRTPGAPPPAHAHTHFHVVSLPIHDTLDLEILGEKLEELPPAFVRIKGIAQVIDREAGESAPKFVAFHRVGARVSSEPVRGTPAGRVVAIGNAQINRDALAAVIQDSVIRSK